MLALLLLATSPLSAQNQDQSGDHIITEGNRTSILIKRIDEQGNEVIEIIENDTEDILRDGESNIIISKDGSNGVHIDVDDLMQDLNIDVEVNDGYKKIRVKGVDQNGEKVDIQWEGAGDLPEDVRERLEALNIRHFDDSTAKGSAHYQLTDQRPFLGVVMSQKKRRGAADQQDFVVSRVVAGSAAEAAGIQAGDVITAIGGESVRNLRELRGALGQHQVGDQVELAYRRAEREMRTPVTLKSREDRLYRSGVTTAVGAIGKTLISTLPLIMTSAMIRI